MGYYLIWSVNWVHGSNIQLIGRKRTIQVAAVIALIAGIVQAAAVNVSMLIAGRILGGFAVGMMSMLSFLSMLTGDSYLND